jgi:hypothetical protein
MATISEFRCDVCGTVTTTPVHWFVIQCSSDELKLMKWYTEAAADRGSRHYCGESHAQVYISSVVGRCMLTAHPRLHTEVSLLRSEASRGARPS